MRYKNLVSQKLEQLENALIGLNSLAAQGASRQQLENWLDQTKEKIEEIQALLNLENQD